MQDQSGGGCWRRYLNTLLRVQPEQEVSRKIVLPDSAGLIVA